ncbi:MAG: P-II family nitrogen regulator [Clostridia bacterium]|nr:P-II family nitrogen regulator [Clostridia bacterium]
MTYKHEVIFCIVNAGFSDAVMDAAKEFGARGGTVIHARGTANSEAERLFEITVQPEKEIVMILVPTEIKNDILHALYRAVGLKTPGQGIAFSMPVTAAVGLADHIKWDPKPSKNEKKQEG